MPRRWDAHRPHARGGLGLEPVHDPQANRRHRQLSNQLLQVGLAVCERFDRLQGNDGWRKVESAADHRCQAVAGERLR